MEIGEIILELKIKILLKRCSKNFLLKKYLKEDVFNGQKIIWQYFNNKKDLTDLNMQDLEIKMEH